MKTNEELSLEARLATAQRERDEAREEVHHFQIESGALERERDSLAAKLEEIKARNVINAIARFCGECGHTLTEDGCAFCLAARCAKLEAAVAEKHDALSEVWSLHERQDFETILEERVEHALSTTCGQPLLDRLELLTEVYRLGEKAHSGGWPTPDDWIAFRKAVLKAREALETK